MDFEKGKISISPGSNVSFNPDQCNETDHLISEAAWFL